ncbi:MAG: hypothetical protein FJ102_22510 [Deltaproteobacteria bacterium]|nr:hypothetical protein [Deltaproteobacteria bacterium]
MQAPSPAPEKQSLRFAEALIVGEPEPAAAEEALPAEPALLPIVTRGPERRKALEASPSPMALAMSLDSPAITYSSALLPSGAFPTFTVKYKELPGENL